MQFFSKFKGEGLNNAVCIGDVEKVGKLLDAKFNKVDVDYMAKDGFTALHHAVASCRDKVAADVMVRKLLQAGANPNASSRNTKAGMIGWTALHMAAEYNRIDIMRTLVDGGADKDATTQDGKSVVSIVLRNQRVSEQDRRLMLDIMGATHLMPGRASHTASEQLAPSPVAQGPSLQTHASTDITESKGSTATTYPKDYATQPKVPVLEHRPEPDDLDLYSGGDAIRVSQPVGRQVVAVGQATLALTPQLVATVAGHIVMVNPAAFIQVTLVLLAYLVQSMTAVTLFKHRSARIAERCQAIEPSLVALNGIVMRRDSGLNKQQARAIVVAVSLLGRVMTELKSMMELMDGVRSSRAAMLKHVLVEAHHHQQQLDDLEKELRHSVNCLNLILNITQISQNVATARALQHLADMMPGQWEEQNEQDRKQDIAELQDNILKLFDSVENLKEQLEEHSRQVKEDQALGLQQVSEWLAQMGADNSRIAAYLEQKIDALSDRVGGVQATLDNMMAAMMQQFNATQSQGHHKLFIPRTTIQVPDGALESGMSGSYGKVVRALRDGGPVALKVYNYKLQLPGARDCEEAVREAVMLSYACHHNVVRCYGIVHDPDDSNRQGSIHGSLVMEWVGGGTLNEWMQDHWRTSLDVRLHLACQVAAGMLHLHEQGLIHGDLKPQNVLMTEQLPSQALPTVKICDFGLSKLVSSSMRFSTRAHQMSCTAGYTSPERLKSYKRSQPDDVFAFGILMYFIAESRSPFSDIPELDLKPAIMDGLRPPIEEWAEGLACADTLTKQVAGSYCALAKRCWLPEADKRPGFQEIYAALRDMESESPSAAR